MCFCVCLSVFFCIFACHYLWLFFCMCICVCLSNCLYVAVCMYTYVRMCLLSIDVIMFTTARLVKELKSEYYYHMALSKANTARRFMPSFCYSILKKVKTLTLFAFIQSNFILFYIIDKEGRGTFSVGNLVFIFKLITGALPGRKRKF